MAEGVLFQPEHQMAELSYPLWATFQWWVGPLTCLLSDVNIMIFLLLDLYPIIPPMSLRQHTYSPLSL